MAGDTSGVQPGASLTPQERAAMLLGGLCDRKNQVDLRHSAWGNLSHGLSRWTAPIAFNIRGSHGGRYQLVGDLASRVEAHALTCLARPKGILMHVGQVCVIAKGSHFYRGTQWPAADVMAAIKLLIETDEELFVQTAFTFEVAPDEPVERDF